MFNGNESVLEKIIILSDLHTALHTCFSFIKTLIYQKLNFTLIEHQLIKPIFSEKIIDLNQKYCNLIKITIFVYLNESAKKNNIF